MSTFGPPPSPEDEEDDQGHVGATDDLAPREDELPERVIVISESPFLDDGRDRERQPIRIDLDEVDLRSRLASEDVRAPDAGPASIDPVQAPTPGPSVDAGGLGPFPDWAAERWTGLEASAAARPVPDDLPSPTEPPAAASDETGPGTLRPKVPEPVLAARTTTSPSRTRGTVSRMRALLGLVVVVVLAGAGLAAAIGAAVLLVVLALGRAFGSG